MGAEYLSYVKSIATFAPTFYGYIVSVLASVERELTYFLGQIDTFVRLLRIEGYYSPKFQP